MQISAIEPDDESTAEDFDRRLTMLETMEDDRRDDRRDDARQTRNP